MNVGSADKLQTRLAVSCRWFRGTPVEDDLCTVGSTLAWGEACSILCAYVKVKSSMGGWLNVVLDPFYLLGFAGGIALVILGAALFLIRPYRVPQVFFALFSMTWGIQIAFFNLGNLQSDSQLHYLMALLASAAMPVVTLFLIHFAMITRRRRFSWVITTLTAAISVVAAGVLVTRPDLVVESVQQGQLVFGSLNFLLFTIPQRLAFLVALLVMYLDYRQSKVGTPRRRIRGILIAFALYLSHNTAQILLADLSQPGQIIEFASGSVVTSGGISDFLLTVLFLITGAVLLALVAHLILRPPPPEGIDSPIIFAFLFPAVVAAIEFTLGMVGIPFETRGFWKILAVGVIVYTLANYHLFGFEMQVKRHVGPILAGVLVLFGIPTLLTLALGEFGFQAISFAVIPQVIGVAGIVLFQDRVKDAFFPGVENTPDYTHQRKLDIYRVALEETLQRGGTPDDPQLHELRLRHGITEQEHSIVAWMVSSEYRKPSDKSGRGTAQQFEVGQTVLERYRLMRLIGRGTYGRTFLAVDNRTRNEVALKTVGMDTFDGAAAKLLLREARLAASLDHPYVINILDVAELPDRVIVVMEYADNGNLEDQLEEEGRFALPEAVRLVRELLMALEAVHQRGIVHRNLKPKNILLEADGSVRLSDFGAAQSSKKEGPADTDFATKTLQDLLYQSPEQIRGQEATPLSDLYVTGILFHEVLTRRHPFRISGKDDHGIREAILNSKPHLLVDDHDDWVHTFLERALAREPEKRFQNAATMREELEKLAGL